MTYVLVINNRMIDHLLSYGMIIELLKSGLSLHSCLVYVHAHVCLPVSIKGGL